MSEQTVPTPVLNPANNTMPTSPQRPFFNPDMRVIVVPLDNGQRCFVVDDVLLEPERLLALAQAHKQAFKPVDFSAYPGRFLMLPAKLRDEMEDCFRRQMRPLFDARRLLSMHARLSMVTLAPSELKPAQWICHSDHFGLEPAQSIQASVLYLFKDASLGGTGFYQPARPPEEMRALFDDAVRLPADLFASRYAIEPGYLLDSNRYFNRIGGVEARWNRMVFYDGAMLHSGDIRAPDRLVDNPLEGRLTLNGFYTCRRHAR